MALSFGIRHCDAVYKKQLEYPFASFSVTNRSMCTPVVVSFTWCKCVAEIDIGLILTVFEFPSVAGWEFTHTGNACMVGAIVDLVEVYGKEFVRDDLFWECLLSLIIRIEAPGSRKNCWMCLLKSFARWSSWSIWFPLESNDSRALMIFGKESSFSCSSVMPRWL